MRIRLYRALAARRGALRRAGAARITPDILPRKRRGRRAPFAPRGPGAVFHQCATWNAAVTRDAAVVGNARRFRGQSAVRPRIALRSRAAHLRHAADEGRHSRRIRIATAQPASCRQRCGHKRGRWLAFPRHRGGRERRYRVSGRWCVAVGLRRRKLPRRQRSARSTRQCELCRPWVHAAARRVPVRMGRRRGGAPRRAC